MPWGPPLASAVPFVLQDGVAPTLVYATMTPMMAQKWCVEGSAAEGRLLVYPPVVTALGRCNPPGLPQHDVENKNAVAVQTVQAAGVELIEDR
jgi:hypothetical protein